MEMFEFSLEIKKVNACFPKSLNPDKAAIIFSRLEKLTGHQFAQVCDKIINTLQYAPSVSNFLEFAQEFKSPGVEIIPLTHEEWKKENTIFSDEERSEMFGFMKKVALGLVKKEDADKYAKTVQSVIDDRTKILRATKPKAETSCGKCDNGILMAERKDIKAMPFAFRCSCEYGYKRSETWPRWENKFRFTFKEIELPLRIVERDQPGIA